MGPGSSPTFAALDPIVVDDDDMVNPYQDTDMDFLDTARLQMSSESAGQEFDDLFSHPSSSRTVAESNPPCLSPSELSLKRSYQEHEALRQPKVFASESPAESPEDSSPSSSSESPRNHLRNTSIASSTSAVHSENTVMPFGYTADDLVNPDYDHVKDESLFGFDASLPNLEGPYPTGEPDLESSNKAMDAAFDFESAASSPSPLKPGATLQPRALKGSKSRLRGAPASMKRKSTSPQIHHTTSLFFPHHTNTPSPFQPSVMPPVKSPLSPWREHSPSSYLEESFGGINMNGSSQPNSAFTFSPNGLPSGFGIVPSPPLSNVKPEPTQHPVLTVHPTSLKSRVETQIPIKLTLHPLPPGVKKLRLPSHTISKPKFLAPPAAERSPDTVELYTSLFCTSALQDKDKLRKALARARGESVRRSSSSSPMATDESQEEDKPVDGAEVKICSNCIQRERKRAFRKKQRKPEEDELFQKHEEKRVIVFNTHEIKDWTEPSKTAASNEVQVPGVPHGAMQVELPMRIACYCRHQNEKIGFQAIFTLKDYKDNVIAQAITNSIMITDDHKTHAPSGPPAPGPPPALPDGTELPGIGVFPSGPSFDTKRSSGSVKQASASPSATDIQGLQQRLNSQYQPGSGPFMNSTNGATPSNSQRSLSRQTSPNEFQGPTSKRRKHSSSSRLPSELTMTKLENGQSSARASSNESQFSAPRGFASPTERPFVTSAAMSNHFSNGPLTPTNGETNPFLTNLQQQQQQQNLDNFIQQQLMSAPNSAQPSRPGTPGGSARNGFQEQNLNLSLGPTPSTPMWPGVTNAGNRLPTVIHKLVPAEGSINGGTEVTLLGSGFYPGMEVVFGDTLATTTTFWGDKCLNCLTPPALQPGQVVVVFKHEHPSFNQLQQQPQPLLPKQQQFFRYVDDRELQMYRLALGILGHKLGNQADAFHTAQQIMGSDYKGAFNLQKDFQGSSSGNQRQVPGLESQGKLGDMDSKMLTYLEFIDLDDNPRAPRYNTRCATGQTLLHFASSLGLTRFVAGLLARGANPDVQDNTGNTPMHLAALNGHAHIVNRLRLAGSSPNVRSIRGFTPADLASTLPAHQAALIPARHRSRSAGSLTSRRRHSSSASLQSLWESSSASGSFDHTVDDSEETSDEDDEFSMTTSRRPSMHQDAVPPRQTPEPNAAEGEARPFSPPAALVAWRNQLQTQINQFQQSVSNAFPNLPNLPALPPMPALPDYQAHPMMRRITNLVPHRPGSSRGAKEGWWDMLTGNSSPGSPASPGNTELPSYDELYPRKEGQGEEEVERAKKASLLQAAAEAALDQHFETQASSSRVTGEQEREDLQDIRIGRNVISREQQKHLREQQARRMKGLGSDRNLYFFWIPLLILVIFAWARSYIPGISQGISDVFEFVQDRYTTQRVLDVGT